MRVSIRKATAKDLPLLQEFCFSLYKNLQQYDALIKPDFVYENEGENIKMKMKDNGQYFLAEIENEVIGYAMGKICKDPHLSYKRIEVDELFIKETFRGKGIGTKFINEFIKIGKAAGAERVIVAVMVKNEGALNLYTKLNFSPRYVVLEQKI